MTVRRIGLDIGGVIRADRAGGDVLLDDEAFMARPAIEGAFIAVKQIVVAFGTEQVFIVSKCREATELRLRGWLVAKGFYAETGFDDANLNFCRERADKAPIAQKLGLAHFVDDHVEVLQHMRGSVPYLYAFGSQADQQRESTEGYILVATWEAALREILSRH